MNIPTHVTNLRLTLPEVIWLEPTYFDWARDISQQVTGELHQWQTYLNALALLGFEQWLREHNPEIVNRDINIIETASNLKLGEFKFCLIATEHLLDEVVNIPQNAIDTPELAAHFYVLLEVLEEQEEIVIRGFLRYDELVDYRGRKLELKNGYYQLPLSKFDPEPNHLLFYCRFLEPSIISLPVATTESAAENLLGYLNLTRTKLSQWLQEIFDESWQSIDSLIDPNANFAWSLRNNNEAIKRGKLINLQMQLGSQNVVLLVNVKAETDEKLGVLIQLHPTGKEKFLLPNLKLTLLSKGGERLCEVLSRYQDSYIQLNPFKGEHGKCFSVEVSLEDITVRENFEL
ncbi:DUF1822 family protein [Nostoc sp. FACHB-133]|uniref:DUF1822 family protein n=1 Tax=Nostoc sp. FACHB-133 TaxID=2692835 RepID=UPI0016865FD2|nr:DUF1822 family protein [Nostoc sp. FACHB-133]MBD2526662.1 DUF1822 family protein [Nostoc sp. FACHB-133]